MQIEFLSILLPADITSGSIVDINVARDETAEDKAVQKFGALQEDIYSTFGIHSPLVQLPVFTTTRSPSP